MLYSVLISFVTQSRNTKCSLKELNCVQNAQRYIFLDNIQLLEDIHVTGTTQYHVTYCSVYQRSRKLDFDWLSPEVDPTAWQQIFNS